jgi:hypothetical protein
MRDLVSHFEGGTWTEGFSERSVEDVGPKWEEDGTWRKLHNDKLRSLYSSPNIFRVIKSKRIRWAVHVARMEEGIGFYSFLVERSEGKSPLGGRITLS